MGLLLVGHGSRRGEANETLREIARLVAARGGFDAVRVGFLELAAPSIADAYADLAGTGCTRVVVHPYFLYPGDHTTRDIPAQLADAAERHPGVECVLTEPLGVHDKLADVVADRVRHALGD